ncbi:LmeA family phospholipid-binding protein [Streptacidiphilus albus]|uniref:LmeA family phospholipid-binding protein n=1 Tax=Streptacidiphilus albus TaxID=105425 RepID=UPI00054AFFD6|nr:DUF2993 domain-containing protein [Streptacidiphilus albus]
MRALRRLIIVLVVLFGLFAAADRIAVYVAEGQAASALQNARGLSQKPSVSIEGFPFLTQLLGGSLDEVKIHANELAVTTPSGTDVTLQNFSADLKGVRLESGFSKAVADNATGTATISYADISAALPKGVTVAYGGGDKVKVSGSASLPVLGEQQVSGTASLNVVGGDRISLSGISGVTGVDPALAGLVTSLLEPQFQLSGLPTGLQLTQITAEPTGVSVGVAGTGVVLNSSQ